MAKKRKTRVAEDEALNDEEVPAIPPKNKQKKNKQQVHDMEAAEEQLGDETCVVIASLKKHKGAANIVTSEVDEDPPKKKSKNKSSRSQHVEDEEGEQEEVPAIPPNNKQKQNKQQVHDMEVAEEQQGDETCVVIASKKKRKGAANIVTSEVDEDLPKKKSKNKSSRSQHVEDEEGEQDAKEEAHGGIDAPVSDTTPTCKQGGTVFVGGIPWSTGEDVLRKDFEECGEVTNLNLLIDPETGKPRGVAFVTFASAAGVEAALAFDGTDYGGRTLKVNRAEDRGKGMGKGKSDRELEIFLKGMSRDVTEAMLRQDFEQHGPIEKLSFPLNAEGQCKGFAWIIYKTQEAVAKALERHGKNYQGRPLVVEKAGQHVKDGGSKGKGKGKSNPDLEVFIKNMPFEIDEATLRRDFAECGEIERIKLPMKDAEKCMGFAWITFKSKEAVEAALVFNGDDFGGRRLVVEKSGQHRTDGKVQQAPPKKPSETKSEDHRKGADEPDKDDVSNLDQAVTKAKIKKKKKESLS